MSITKSGWIRPCLVVSVEIIYARQLDVHVVSASNERTFCSVLSADLVTAVLYLFCCISFLYLLLSLTAFCAENQKFFEALLFQ